jgi:hypothetical protein
MGVKLSCPRCGTLINVDLAGGLIAVGYEMKDWQRRCDRAHADGPTACRDALASLKQHLVGDIELVDSR